MLAGIKTFIVYWLLAGVVSAVLSIMFALTGNYSIGLNVANMVIGLAVALGVYFYRRKK